MDNSNERGTHFESRILTSLRALSDRHPGFVEVNRQTTITLLNRQRRKPDFELVYRTDQEHHELIECQSRERSSLEIADKIKNIKLLSNRNRFLFIFEDITCQSDEHLRILTADGVNCLTVDELDAKLDQIHWTLCSMKDAVKFHELSPGQQNWHRVLELLHERYERERQREREWRHYDRPSEARPRHWHDD